LLDGIAITLDIVEDAVGSGSPKMHGLWIKSGANTFK
jgi:hypothetical protein